MRSIHGRGSIGGVALALLVASPALAQHSGAPQGSPAATRTIGGEQLRAPPEKFGGKIEETAAKSTPFWPARIVPPKGAPNVLLIMPRSLPFTLQWDENLDIGSDTLTGVNDADYKPPFAFTGTLDRVTLTIDRPKLTPEDEKKLLETSRSHAASE